MIDKELQEKIWLVSNIFQSEDVDTKPLTREQRQDILFVIWKLVDLQSRQDQELKRLQVLVDKSKSQ